MVKLQWTREQLSPSIFSMRKLSNIITKSTEICFIEDCSIYQGSKEDIILKFIASDSNGSLRTLFVTNITGEKLSFKAGESTPFRLKKDWESGGLSVDPRLLRKELIELFVNLQRLEIPIERITWNTLSSMSTGVQLQSVKLNKVSNEYVLVFS